MAEEKKNNNENKPKVAFAYVKGGSATFEQNNSTTNINTNGVNGNAAGFVIEDANVKIKQDNSKFNLNASGSGDASSSSKSSQPKARSQTRTNGGPSHPEGDMPNVNKNPAKFTKLKVRYDEEKFTKEFRIDTCVSEIIAEVKRRYNANSGNWILLYGGKAIADDLTLEEVGIYDSVVEVVRMSGSN